MSQKKVKQCHIPQIMWHNKVSLPLLTTTFTNRITMHLCCTKYYSFIYIYKRRKTFLLLKAQKICKIDAKIPKSLSDKSNII